MVTKVKRKTFTIRPSGRSTDYIAPSFGFGCLVDCLYCYMKRHVSGKQLNVSSNYLDILSSINEHAAWLPPKIPNQTDSVYYTYDIACNEDFALHAKYHNWEDIFDFFKKHDKVKASLATKIIPTRLLSFNPNKKVRIRFSLMPQKYSTLLEPNTPLIIDRIKAIDTFVSAGYEVHINYSPIIVYGNWLKEYRKLFTDVNTYVTSKNEVLCECIFLTHNERKHIENVSKGKQGEAMLWQPYMQEVKQSQYGGDNLRYRKDLKETFISEFKKLHSEVVPWNTIRYIF